MKCSFEMEIISFRCDYAAGVLGCGLEVTNLHPLHEKYRDAGEVLMVGLGEIPMLPPLLQHEDTMSRQPLMSQE